MTLPQVASGQERRKALIAGATQVFARFGYAGASLRELARAAGMEKGHLTYYFATKELLLYEIVDDLHERFLGLRQHWPVEAGDAGLLEVFELHLSLVMTASDQARVAYDNFRFLSGHPRATIVAKRRAYEHALAGRIDAARPLTPIADMPTTMLTKALLGHLNWPYQWYQASGPTPVDDLARQLAGRALAALRPLD